MLILPTFGLHFKVIGGAVSSQVQSSATAQLYYIKYTKPDEVTVR